jgi:HD-like signal output (HDOD) protein
MSNPDPVAAGHRSDEAFAFVSELAADLSKGNVELPSFPDIAMRVRSVLSNDDVPTVDVVRVIGSEPALAARILSMANSAALGRSDRPIADLRSAVTRIGFNLVRSAAIAFAMAQLRRVEALKDFREPLAKHWERSASVAAYSYVVARRHAGVNPDTALLAGLLHGVGKLYILARGAKHPKLFADHAAYHAIELDWHATIARAILENWGLSDDVIDAVHDHEDLAREHNGVPDLTDVLTIASLLTTFHAWPDTLELNLQGVKAAERMRLDRKALDALVAEADREVALIKQTLGM